MTRILDGKVAFVTGGGSGIGEAGSKKHIYNQRRVLHRHKRAVGEKFLA